MTEVEMAGWHHQLDGHEFEQALEVGDGQGRLVCCSPWGSKELDITEWMNWTEMNLYYENMVLNRKKKYNSNFSYATFMILGKLF